MKYLILFLLSALSLPARTLLVGDGGDYETLEDAAKDVMPGDTMYVMFGNYPGGLYLDNLQGEPGNYITIKGEGQGDALFEGGTQAIHFVNPRYLRIEDLNFRGQTGNGVNIDDGGDYSSPAGPLEIRNCKWLSMDATGNNDMLKMSGVDNFIIENCRFTDGSPGGSMIDFVGCHEGTIQDNYFENAGSNCIQAKGGTENLVIRRNRFINGGHRAINIGGSTGLAFFRPIDAEFESARILVNSNIFIGGATPFGFVGTTESKAYNNTIIHPESWAFRILQETTDERFVRCSFNEVRNNIFILDNKSTTPAVNIGPNTLPETFSFSNNLWHNSDNPDWPGPNLPAEETAGVYGQEPMFLANPEYGIPENSPARKAGVSIEEVELDYGKYPYAEQPAIGAYEWRDPSGIFEKSPQNPLNILYLADGVYVRAGSEIMEFSIVDITGKSISPEIITKINPDSIYFETQNLGAGTYLILVKTSSGIFTGKFLKK
jgi:hypothetical protein